jgi:hypothetical protein
MRLYFESVERTTGDLIELLLLHSRSHPGRGILACELTFQGQIRLFGSSLLIFSPYKTDAAHGTLITRGAHVNLGSARGKGTGIGPGWWGRHSGEYYAEGDFKGQLKGFAAKEQLNVGRR